MAFVIPLVRHHSLSVMLFYAVTMFTAGVVVSVVFQLAHCVEEAEFTVPEKDSSVLANTCVTSQPS